MYNPQFQGERNSYTDIEERLWMEIRDTTEVGLPDDDANLIQILEDARTWIKQAKKVYRIPDNWQMTPEPSRHRDPLDRFNLTQRLT